VTTGARPGPFDVLVLGSGVAGLSAAVRLAGPGAPSSPALSLGVLTKGVLSQSATRWAQGGVAAVLGGDEDSTDLHLADTLAAGAGLCDEEAVRILVGEGPGRVHELIALGVEFDREATGSLALAREGGHSRPRVVHAGGAATGAEVERALVDATVGRLHFLGRRWLAAVGHLRCSLAPLLSMPPRARSMSNLVAVCHAAICGMGTLHMLQAHDECAVLQKRIRRCVVEWLHEHRSADPNAAVACFIWSRRLRHSCEIVEWLERYRRSSADRAETAALLHEFRDHEAYVRSELALETTNPLNHSMYDAVRAMCERF